MSHVQDGHGLVFRKAGTGGLFSSLQTSSQRLETTRRFAHHGYLAICANLYERAEEGNCADLWGGRVVMDKEELNAKTPVAAVRRTSAARCLASATTTARRARSR
jgi:dienelactone hydrolase